MKETRTGLRSPTHLLSSRGIFLLPFLHLAAECLAYSESMPPLDVDGVGVPEMFTRNAQFRDYARWLVAESIVLLYEGKPLDAVQTDALVFGLARQAASPGSILSLLVGESVDSIALGGLRVILYHDGENATVSEAVVQAIDRRRTAPDLGLALRVEVVLNLAMSDSDRIA